VWYIRANSAQEGISFIKDHGKGSTVSLSRIKRTKGPLITRAALLKNVKKTKHQKGAGGRANRILHAHAFSNCKLQNYCIKRLQRRVVIVGYTRRRLIGFSTLMLLGTVSCKITV